MADSDSEFYDCEGEEINHGPEIAHGSKKASKIGSSQSAVSADSALPSSSYEKDSNSEADGQTTAPYGGRSQLPARMIQRSDYSMFQFLRHFIGKDLTSISMPVVLNEPLSFLQRLAEYVEYWRLLEKANDCYDPLERLEYVMAFAVSTSVGSYGRLFKPFNPLLGETYEFYRRAAGYRFVAEQVSHHPPISAFYCEVPGLFRFSGSVGPKLKLNGQYCEIQPRGLLTLELPRYGDVYTWQNVNTHVHNILVGKMWLEMVGDLEIVNHTKECSASLTYKRAKLFGKDPFHLEGYLYNGIGDDREKMRVFYGCWHEALFSVPVGVWDEYKHAKKRHKKPSKTPGPHTNLNCLSPKVGCDGEGTDEPCESSCITSESYSTGAQAKCDLKLLDQKLLLRTREKPACAKDFYGFSYLATVLNEIGEEEKALGLPPTDSRYRQDLRAFENGDIEKATEEKQRLEEKQRGTRHRKQKVAESDQSPLWFKLEKHRFVDKEAWVFTGDYNKRDWSKCPNIF